MSRHRSRKKFFNSFFILFLSYLIIAPTVFFMLDFDSAVKAAKKDLGSFLMKMTGIALLISFVIAFWWRKDPELRRG